MVNKTSENIRKVVLQALHLIAPEADLQLLNVDASLREELDIDSVDFIRFVLLLHEELIIDIPEADYANLATLKSCFEYLNSKMP